ncbi:MAG: hypothetical protein NT062_09455 [Proteobacteria bacterium]|nr:hypothetical protein [Pseudomonadota bacterium]
MRRHTSPFALLVSTLSLLVVGCGDDGSTRTGIDAPAAGLDGPVSTIDAPPVTVDAPAGNACTGAAYDPCTAAGQCLSGNCKLFSSAGIQVCTQACSAANPCPMQNGAAVPCNNMGVCRPQTANTCTR